MNYREKRNYENLQRARFRGAGRYGIPEILPEYSVAENWIGFNYAKGCGEPHCYGVHFFIDDYQFMRVWTNPDAYIGLLSRFEAVCAPDFSTYADFPEAVQIYNHYRKHWCGAYWQSRGVTVIPTVSWSDEGSFDWCFDGEPEGSVVAVSSVGTQGSAKGRRLFEQGFGEMVRRLHPSQVIMYGSVPEACFGYGVGIERVGAFHEKWKIS